MKEMLRGWGPRAGQAPVTVQDVSGKGIFGHVAKSLSLLGPSHGFPDEKCGP